MSAAGLAKLREPFAPNQIGKLPKQMKKDDQDKGKCEKGSRYSADGHVCGGWHARSIHLDYVGHAALTDRLLDVDPAWTWEPMAVGPDGSPVLDHHGGLWIRLTVLGVTRLGYGDAQGKSGGNSVKEAIGDALRNAGMRFGLALDLWHKGDLRAGDPDPPVSDLTSLKRTVVAEGQRLGWSVNDVSDDYAAAHDHKIKDSTTETLTAYLAKLKALPTPEATS